jgi:hypothetical protein
MYEPDEPTDGMSWLNIVPRMTTRNAGCPNMISRVTGSRLASKFRITSRNTGGIFT